MTHEHLELKVSKLTEYIQEMARQHNELEKRVEALEDVVNGSAVPLYIERRLKELGIAK